MVSCSPATCSKKDVRVKKREDGSAREGDRPREREQSGCERSNGWFLYKPKQKSAEWPRRNGSCLRRKIAGGLTEGAGKTKRGGVEEVEMTSLTEVSFPRSPNKEIQTEKKNRKGKSLS